MPKIPNTLVLFISGVSCVGKTAVAQNLIKICPDFRSISEMDIIRTIARSIVKDVALSNNISTSTICEKELYDALFKSTKQNDFRIYKQQASFFVNYVGDIVKRQQSRKIPSIIEGINIVPSLYFKNNKPIAGFETNIVFINLYLSDYSAHVQRRFARCQERGYPDTYDDAKSKVNLIANKKQEELIKETITLEKEVKNVFNIDTFNKSIEEVSNEILDIIYRIFPN